LNGEAKPLQATLSFWLVVFGLVGSRHGKTRAAAAGALLLCGAGYLGVLHERLASADLRRYRHADFKQISPVQVAAHLAAAGFGWRLMRGHS